MNTKPSHWIVAIGLSVLGIFLGSVLDSKGYFLQERYKLYQWTQEFTPQTERAKRTALVLIGDEEYWHQDSELARRQPIKRTYLAKLLRTLGTIESVRIIALDFDLRAPMRHGTALEHPDYEAERQDLLAAIETVSRNRIVILPKTIDYEAGYFLEPAIFDDRTFDGLKVKKGYINLFDDTRTIPLQLLLKDGSYAESFAESIATSLDKRVIESLQHTKYPLPYGRYLTAQKFLTVSANFILHADPSTLNAQFENRQIVIIGGAWSRWAYQRGPQIDTYLTPVGLLGGVYIHANYVEALLDSRTYTHWGKGIVLGSEFLTSMCVAMIAAWKIAPLRKLAAFVLLIALLPVLSYFSMHLVGKHFEFFIPLVLLNGHAAVEKILEWRDEARAHLKKKEDK